MMEIGKKLNGRYKIIGTVGGGGMAHVYLAHDLILDRDVAVKVLRYDFREDQDTIRRFKREALAATELVHPNIVSVYDIGEENHNQYIVMEYVKGMDLKKYIHNYFPIPYQKVIDIMSQVLSAVADAHHNRIIHRDLKPQNILIDETGVVKITDFGIAVALSQTSITQTNSLLGSVHYLSPEQARGGMATNQSDIYSLGIILYELLTGNVPFDGESAVSIALKHFQETVPSVKDYDHRIPQALENVVLKATAKETADRYPSVHEMAADLATSLSAQRINEPKFVPASMIEQTKVIEPIKPVTVPVTSPKPDGEEAAGKENTTNQTNKDQKPKKKKRKVLWLVLLGLLILGLGTFFAIALTAPKDISVPDLSGMTEEEATKVLAANELVLGKVIEEADDEIEEGLVIQTNPKNGSSIKEHSSVDLLVSSGKETITFLDYTGKPYEEVRAELREQKFVINRVDESSDTVDEGLIISQDIYKDQEVVPSETTVTFTVSTGEAGFEIRDLSGYSEKGVQDYANEKNLNVTITSEYSDDVTKGQVISQEPAAGEVLYSGASISVVVSQGPEEIPLNTFTKTVKIPYKKVEEPVASSSESTEDSASESSSEEQLLPNEITIYIEDEEHKLETVYQQFEITEDTELDLPFVLKEGSKGSYRIIRDGEAIEEKTDVAP